MENFVANMTLPLKLADIMEWLGKHHSEYQKLASDTFAPSDDNFFDTYFQLEELVRFCPHRSRCYNALTELKDVFQSEFTLIVEWVKKYSNLRLEELVGFEIWFLDWKEETPSEILKIHEHLYTEKTPFEIIIWFIEIFDLLYYQHAVTNYHFNETEQFLIREQLKCRFAAGFLEEHEKLEKESL